MAAKGTEASNLAKVNLAPFHAGRSVVERPKPFNTWVLLILLRIPSSSSKVVYWTSRRPRPFCWCWILTLAPACAEILLKSTHIGVLCRNGVFLRPIPDQRLCLPDGETAFYDLPRCANLISPG